MPGIFVDQAVNSFTLSTMANQLLFKILGGPGNMAGLKGSWVYDQSVKVEIRQAFYVVNHRILLYMYHRFYLSMINWIKNFFGRTRS